MSLMGTQRKFATISVTVVRSSLSTTAFGQLIFKVHGAAEKANIAIR